MRAITVLAFGLMAVGCDSAAPTKNSAELEQITVKAKPVQPAPAAVAKPKADPAPKKETAAKVEPKKEEPKKQPSEFDKAWDELVGRASRLRKVGEEEYAEKKRMLTNAEIELIESMLAQKPMPTAFMGAPEIILLENSGLAKLSSGLRFQWAISDPEFRKRAELVWNRTPKSRSSVMIGSFAGKWMINPPDQQRALIAKCIDLVEAGKDLSASQRDFLVSIVGDEYYSNRDR